MSSFIPALLIKLTTILAVGLIIVGALRAASPSLKHIVLFATLTSALLLPVAMALSPSWNVPVLPQASTQMRAPAIAIAGSTDRSSSPGSALPANDARFRMTTTIPDAGEQSPTLATVGSWAERAAAAIPLAWALGCFAVLAWLTIGRLRLSRIGRSAWPLDSADWTKILDEEQREAGVELPVRLCSSPVVSTPLTWGWRQPVILLPEDAGDWSDEHRRIVLRHELAHIARRDSLAQLIAGISCALYWFHPAVWAAERRLRAECERACDDRVVSQGTPAAEYAAHLLEVARSARAFGAPGFLSVAMARPSQLEGRLLAVLSESRRRASTSRGARHAVAALSFVVLLPLAALKPVPTGDASVTTTSDGAKSFAFTTSSGDGSSMVQSTTIGHKSLGQPAEEPHSGSDATSSRAAGFDSTFALSTPARAGGTLSLDLKTGGAITITGWDRPEVAVEARLKGRDWRETEVRLRGSAGGATLESVFTGSSTSFSSSNAFTISVPRNFNVRVNSAGGAVNISNVEGQFSGVTGGGEINIRNSRGSVDLATGGGDIEVADSQLDGQVSTGGGMVKIERVSGDLNGSSGSGPVTYIRSGSSSSVSESQSDANTLSIGRGRSKRTINSSAITMTSAGGDVRLPEAPNGAYVTTGGGHIRIGPSGGTVYAETGGGPIDVGPATGSVEAVTGAGDVRIELEGSGNHAVNVSSGTGEVTLELPADLNATLDLETAYTNNFGRKTRIKADFPVQTTETTTWDDDHGTPRRYVRAHQTIGRGGPVIRIRTVNGDINLLRR
jgi:beta-lactamase regulating signal transducer with metallopeptidase domain/DUF4097 and DUF4098 domain-containing protein YvlB